LVAEIQGPAVRFETDRVIGVYSQMGGCFCQDGRTWSVSNRLATCYKPWPVQDRSRKALFSGQIHTQVICAIQYGGPSNSC
jgi:hypothetical protein